MHAIRLSAQVLVHGFVTAPSRTRGPTDPEHQRELADLVALRRPLASSSPAAYKDYLRDFLRRAIRQPGYFRGMYVCQPEA